MRFLEYINETTLPERYKPWGVGKRIGGKIYLHKQYEDLIPIIKERKELLGTFEYNLVSYDPKSGNVTFTNSPDFDTANEPIVGAQCVVSEDKKKFYTPSPDPWIYHHKWLWVKDDYKGFDVEKAKTRSAHWTSIPVIDYSRIGKRSFWERFLKEHGYEI